MRDMEKMKIELNEHRITERIRARTQHLMARILAESCNASLCDKLACAYKQPATIKLQTFQSALTAIAPPSVCPEIRHESRRRDARANGSEQARA